MTEVPRTLAGAAAMGACALAFALGPASASAASVVCGGTVARSALPNADKNELDYGVHCSEPIKAYSILATAPLDTFGAETNVEPSPGGQPGKLFSCEGRIPSMGFGCSGGDLPVGAWVRSSFVAQKGMCSQPKAPLRAFVVGVDANGNASEPFKLKTPRCPKPKTRRRHHAA